MILSYIIQICWNYFLLSFFLIKLMLSHIWKETRAASIPCLAGGVVYWLRRVVSELLGFCDITTDWFPEMCIEAPLSGACKPCKGGTLLISMFIYRLSDISCQNLNFAQTWPSKTQLDWQQCFSAVCSASTKAPAARLPVTQVFHRCSFALY